MPIRVECFDCGEQYRVPDHAAGKRLRCRGCDGPIPVPGPGGAPRRRRRQPVADYDDFDDEGYDHDYEDGYDDEYESRPRRRSPRRNSRRERSHSNSGSDFRWGPLVALAGIPFLFVGFVIGGTVGTIIAIVFMNIMFGVSAAISASQKGHPAGLGVSLALFGLLGLLFVSFLPDNNSPAPKNRRRRRR